MSAEQDTLREDCDESADCVRNCCVNPIIAPVFFVVFVLMAQFVLVNVVVAVLMKHLEVYSTAAISIPSKQNFKRDIFGQNDFSTPLDSFRRGATNGVNVTIVRSLYLQNVTGEQLVSVETYR